jgi:hypothetical protein
VNEYKSLPLGLTLKRSTSFMQLVESSDTSATTLDTTVGPGPRTSQFSRVPQMAVANS